MPNRPPHLVGEHTPTSTAIPRAGAPVAPSPRTTTPLYMPSRDTRLDEDTRTPPQPARISHTIASGSGAVSNLSTPSESQYRTLPWLVAMCAAHPPGPPR